MSELVGFPMESQRDGSINGDYNCVPTSIAAGIKYLTGKFFYGWQLKDVAYGPDYQGGTAASAYVSFCDAQGVNLYARSGDCIQIAHEELAKGHPVVFTQQDDYSTNPDYTHVCVWYKDGSGGLTAMDPFIAAPLFYSDDVWRARLRASDVWIMEKKSMVPSGWKDDGATLTAPNGHRVVKGFRDYVLNHNWDSNNVPLAEEEGANPVEEGYSNNPPGGTRQIYNYCELGWTSARGVFVVGVGNELAYVRKDRDNIKAQLAAAQAQLAANQNTDVTALKQKIDADKATAQAILAAAQHIAND